MKHLHSLLFRTWFCYAIRGMNSSFLISPFKYVQSQCHNDIKHDELNLDGTEKYMLHPVHNLLSSHHHTEIISNISCHWHLVLWIPFTTVISSMN
jgi:hypothetical protein